MWIHLFYFCVIGLNFICRHPIVSIILLHISAHSFTIKVNLILQLAIPTFKSLRDDHSKLSLRPVTPPHCKCFVKTQSSGKYISSYHFASTMQQVTKFIVPSVCC